MTKSRISESVSNQRALWIRQMAGYRNNEYEKLIRSTSSQSNDKISIYCRLYLLTRLEVEMSDEKKSKATPNKQPIKIPLEWPENVDLPTIYANHLFISHTGPEFFLIFGEATTPLWTEVTIKKVEALGSLEVKPVAKIAISKETMPAIAKVIQENVEQFLAQKGKGEQKEEK